MRHVLLVTLFSSLFRIEGRRKMAPMTARGQRSQGVIKARGLLPQPLDLHFQVIVSKMKNTGHLCPAPSPESETAQLPPKLQAQRPVTAAERTQPPTWPFGRGPAALEMRSRCLLIPGSPAAFLKGAPWAHHVVIPPGVGQRGLLSVGVISALSGLTGALSQLPWTRLLR